MTTDDAAIRAVSDRYCDALTRADLSAIRACFADDAIWEAPSIGMRSEGIDAIIAFLEQITGRMELLLQFAGSHMVTIDGDTAHMRSTVMEIARSRDGQAGVTHYGMYQSDLRRDPDRGWLFAYRCFHSILRDPNPPAGAAFPLPANL